MLTSGLVRPRPASSGSSGLVQLVRLFRLIRLTERVGHKSGQVRTHRTPPSDTDERPHPSAPVLFIWGFTLRYYVKTLVGVDNPFSDPDILDSPAH